MSLMFEWLIAAIRMKSYARVKKQANVAANGFQSRTCMPTAIATICALAVWYTLRHQIGPFSTASTTSCRGTTLPKPEIEFTPVAEWATTKVDEVMTALYDIHDPEIGMSIVDLDLIKNVDIGTDGAPTEIKMVLTTPFCPWAGELIQTVKTKTEEVVGPPVKVTLLAERWEPPPGLF